MKLIVSTHRYILLILLLSVIPFMSLFLTDKLPHTSDGAMHLVRIGSYYKEITAGQFPVRWASDLNYGYGTPLFNFFHPFPYLLAVPFVFFGFGLVGTLKVLFLLSFLLSGVFMYAFSRSLFEDEFTAFFVTVFYQFAPFRLVEAIVRGGVGTVFSYAFLPLVLFAAVRFQKTGNYRYFFLTSLASGLLIFSHSMLALVFLSLSGMFILFFIKTLRGKVLSLLSLFLGVLLASTFLLPVALEYKYTYGYLFSKNLFYDHFVSMYKFFIPNFFDTPMLRVAEVSVQFGLFQVLSIILAIIYLFRKKKDMFRRLFLFSLLVLLVALFFMTSFSKVLWERLPTLRQFQFPWRLMAAVTLVTSFTAVSYLLFLKKRFVLIFILILTVLSTFYYWKPPQGFLSVNEQDYWNYPLTTNYYGEVDTIWAAGPATKYPKKRLEVIAGQAEITHIQGRAIHQRFTVEAKTPSILVTRTQFFPGWKVYVDGKETSINFQDQNWRGLITFPVPQGAHTVLVIFKQSLIQRLGNAITIVTSLGLLVGFLIFRKKKIV